MGLNIKFYDDRQKEGEIVSVGYIPVDTKARKDSKRLASSGAVAKAEEKADAAAEDLQEQIDEIAEKAGSGYIPKGEVTVATLNALSGQENGELYTMTDAGTLTDGGLVVVAGDTVAWDATNEVWYKAMDYAPRQYGTNEVHNLPTAITAFRTGDVIPVDGPSGTAKMSKDDLLEETAENAAASGIVATPDDFDLVMDGLERSITLSTTAGQDWNAALNIIVLPGKRCILSSVRDTSIADASGTFIAYYTDGSSSSVGSSWAGYGYTFTNNTAKTIYRIRYHFASTAIVGNGSATFTAKVYSLAGDDSASLKYPLKDMFSIVMDDFNKSVTVPTTAGQEWDADIDVIVLPGVKVSFSSVTDGSITSTSGTFIAHYTDGSTANVGSSWPGYGYSFTNNTQKTISRLRYHFIGTQVTGSGSVQFSVKYPSLAGVILPEVKSGLAYNGIICSQGQETSGWTFTSGAFLHKDGTTEALAGYVTSDFIRVFSSSQYSIVEGGQTFGNNQPIVFYNAKKNVIGYVNTGTTNNTPISFDTPKGCEFIRYSCYGNGNNSKLTYTGVNDASLSERVGELECPIESIPIPTIYGVVGKNITLWLDALFRVSPRENFACHLQSGRGAMQMRNALDVDVSSAYSANTKIRWYGNNGTIVLENDVPVKVVAANSKSGQSKKVMVIGDSLTNIGKITSYLLQNFENDAMSIELLGTMGTAPNLREGRGGWSSYDYTHTESYNSYTNAFLNDGVFDFGYYLTQNSIATPDIVVIELGTNDNWRPRNGTTTHENIEEMITSIKAANPSVQIIVMTPQCPYIGFDASVGDTYYARFDLWAIAKEIVEYFGGRTDENIFVSLMGGILNPIYSFQRTEVQACPYSTETISKCTDRIHPLDCGYQQIADELYCAIKGI